MPIRPLSKALIIAANLIEEQKTFQIQIVTYKFLTKELGL
jgi:hypothetical protein